MNENFDVNKILENLETKLKVSRIKINNIFLWPHLRYLIANSLLKTLCNNGVKNHKINKFKNIIILFRNSLYGLNNIFRPCDAIFFSTSKERIYDNDISISKNINEIYKNYKNPLLVEHAFDDMHFNKKKIFEKNILSLTFLDLLSRILIKMKLLKYKLLGEDIISSIKNEFNLDFDIATHATRFISDYHVFKFFLKYKKPKILYITVWYGYGPIIKAAKDLGITTVEVQHGSFDKDHYAYNMNKIIDSSHYPEFILTYSKYYANFFNRQEIIENNIFKAKAVGSYLENRKRNLKISKKNFKAFKYVVSMSATTNNSKLEYDLLDKLSDEIKDVIFIYLPRRENNFKNKKNLKVAKKLTAVNYLPISDLHITVRSTTMYEAAFFGKKTLIYTPFIETKKFIDNLKNELNDYPSLYRFIEKDDNLVSILKKELQNKKINFKEIQKQGLYETGYHTNIRNFIKELDKNLKDMNNVSKKTKKNL